MNIEFLLNLATHEAPFESAAAKELIQQPHRGRKTGIPPKQIHESALTTLAFGQE